MAIDPSIITTVRADQLPVAPVTQESIIMHAIDEVLYQGTIAEIAALIPSVSYKPYEVKWLNVTDLYIDQNFYTEGADKGLGRPDGLWNGWAIMDGAHGTENFDGAVPLGFGASYNTMRQQVGENSKALIKSNIPVLDSTLPGSNDDNSQSGAYVCTSNEQFNENRLRPGTVNVGSPNTPVNIMQKSFVQLFIMKLP